MRTTKRVLPIVVLSALAIAASPAFAQMGGMGGGSGSSSTGGAGMLVVADDGSLLVTQMGMGGGMMGSTAGLQRTLVALGPDGVQRWSKSFTQGWPMMPVTQGDLVVFALVDGWWMGGGSGDAGGTVPTTMQVSLVGLDLATGAQRWVTKLDGDMATLPRFSPDGSRIYLTVNEIGSMGPMATTPMQQGAAPTAAGLMTTRVVALDRNGNTLWTKDLAPQGSSGGMN